MKWLKRMLTLGLLLVPALLNPTAALAHCDTLDGPVVNEARVALQKKEITPVLKWIRREHEPELKNAFARTLAVRSQGKEARELADQFFFETLVRLHRQGEGAPYTGLKPAGTKAEPGIEAADEALTSGRVDPLAKAVTEDAVSGIRRRFEETVEKRAHADHNVEAGRAYVAAYVEFVHYVEALQATATRPAVHQESQTGGHQAASPAASTAPGHAHQH